MGPGTPGPTAGPLPPIGERGRVEAAAAAQERLRPNLLHAGDLAGEAPSRHHCWVAGESLRRKPPT